MSRWSTWRNTDLVQDKELSSFGIYEIRMVDGREQPLPVSRIGGIDEDGIVYIGGAGYSTSRTLAQRIREFQRKSGGHSGRYTYRLMHDVLGVVSKRAFFDDKLQYRAMRMPGADAEMLKQEEVETLARYFTRYGELPPCNSSFPKWRLLVERVHRNLERVRR